MTLDQSLAFLLISATIGAFVWGRLPYDVVAVTALLIGVAIGIVPAKEAFTGFSDDIVIIVASALIISSAIASSGVVETAMRPFLPRLKTTSTQVPVLVGAVLLASMVTKNVGALAIFMPVALQLARRTGTSPSSLLMPMSFASLIGGIVTLVGTSPNIIVAKVRTDLLGQPFGMFDYTPVGLGIAAIGFVFLSFGWRLLPRGRRAASSSMEAAFNLESYTAEAVLPAGSPASGRTVAELEAMAEGDVQVVTIVRERFRRYVPVPDWRLRDDDVLLLRGEPEDLERLVARARLNLAGSSGANEPDITVVEGVVTADSALVGHTPAQL
jgi:di/tricarboxylate transporter